MEILIKAKRAEGKTTMAIAIERCLKDMGFTNVTLFESEPNINLVNLHKGLNSIKENEIKINTVQISKN